MDAPVSFAPPQSANLLIELEARQDDLLRQLDELNARVEQAIAAGNCTCTSIPRVPASNLTRHL